MSTLSVVCWVIDGYVHILNSFVASLELQLIHNLQENYKWHRLRHLIIPCLLYTSAPTQLVEQSVSKTPNKRPDGCRRPGKTSIDNLVRRKPYQTHRRILSASAAMTPSTSRAGSTKQTLDPLGVRLAQSSKRLPTGLAVNPLYQFNSSSKPVGPVSFESGLKNISSDPQTERKSSLPSEATENLQRVHRASCQPDSAPVLSSPGRAKFVNHSDRQIPTMEPSEEDDGQEADWDSEGLEDEDDDFDDANPAASSGSRLNPLQLLNRAMEFGACSAVRQYRRSLLAQPISRARLRVTSAVPSSNSAGSVTYDKECTTVSSGLHWDVICFIFILFQRKVFMTQSFSHVAFDLNVQSQFASRGAYLINQKLMSGIREQAKREQYSLEKIREKLDAIQRRQAALGRNTANITEHYVMLRSGDYYLFEGDPEQDDDYPFTDEASRDDEKRKDTVSSLPATTTTKPTVSTGFTRGRALSVPQDSRSPVRTPSHSAAAFDEPLPGVTDSSAMARQAGLRNRSVAGVLSHLDQHVVELLSNYTDPYSTSQRIRHSSRYSADRGSLFESQLTPSEGFPVDSSVRHASLQHFSELGFPDVSGPSRGLTAHQSGLTVPLDHGVQQSYINQSNRGRIIRELKRAKLSSLASVENEEDPSESMFNQAFETLSSSDEMLPNQTMRFRPVPSDSASFVGPLPTHQTSVSSVDPRELRPIPLHSRIPVILKAAKHVRTEQRYQPLEAPVNESQDTHVQQRFVIGQRSSQRSYLRRGLSSDASLSSTDYHPGAEDDKESTKDELDTAARPNQREEGCWSKFKATCLIAYMFLVSSMDSLIRFLNGLTKQYRRIRRTIELEKRLVKRHVINNSQREEQSPLKRALGPEPHVFFQRNSSDFICCIPLTDRRARSLNNYTSDYETYYMDMEYLDYDPEIGGIRVCADFLRPSKRFLTNTVQQSVHPSVTIPTGCFSVRKRKASGYAPISTSDNELDSFLDIEAAVISIVSPEHDHSAGRNMLDCPSPVVDHFVDGRGALVAVGQSLEQLDALDRHHHQRAKAFRRSRSRAFLFLIALGNLAIVYSEWFCYLLLIVNHMRCSAILSLPYPLMVFLWGMLSVPRPTKTFWIFLITYTERPRKPSKVQNDSNRLLSCDIEEPLVSEDLNTHNVGTSRRGLLLFTHRNPSRTWNPFVKLRRFYQKMTNPQYNKKVDVYIYMFLCEFISFWIMIFGYVSFGPSVIIVIKYIFQFRFIYFNDPSDKPSESSEALWLPRLFGIDKNDHYAVFDLVQLITLFLHRGFLKNDGLWRDDMEFVQDLQLVTEGHKVNVYIRPAWVTMPLNSSNPIGIPFHFHRCIQETVGFLHNFESNDIRYITIDGFSGNIWAITPPSYEALLMKLADPKSDLLIHFHMKCRRQTKEIQTSQTSVEDIFSRKLELVEKQQLLHVLNGTSTASPYRSTALEYGLLHSEAPTHTFALDAVTLNAVMPRYVLLRKDRLRAAFARLGLRETYVNVSFVIHRDPVTPQSWWELKERVTAPLSDPCFERLRTPTLGTSGSAVKVLSVVTFNERVSDSLFGKVFSNYGIIGMYAAYIFLANRLLRTIYSNISYVICLEELPHVDRILNLCNEVYLVREYKLLRLEEQLVAKLFFLYRSSETMIKWTRHPKHIVEKFTELPETDSAPSQPQQPPPAVPQNNETAALLSDLHGQSGSNRYPDPDILLSPRSAPPSSRTMNGRNVILAQPHHDLQMEPFSVRPRHTRTPR
ncbi:hypothetical protein AHF37_01475 [Paragonimus kellicotti]|nr:hypothetical protein AHF37_01475 [Paragonimus kellicotti]